MVGIILYMVWDSETNTFTNNYFHTVTEKQALKIALTRIGEITYSDTSSENVSDWTVKLNASYPRFCSSSNATVRNISIKHSILGWEVDFEVLWPTSKLLVDGRELKGEDGFEYEVTVDGITGYILSFDHCY